MITLEKIIQAEFENISIDEVVKLLAEHSLYEFLKVSISQINQHLNNKEEEIRNFGFLNISHIASIVLIRINEYLRHLSKSKNEKDKSDLEYLLGNITKRIIKFTIDHLPYKNRKAQLILIQTSLYETCLLYKYNFEELTSFIQIDDLVREIYVEYSSKVQNESKLDLNVEKNFPGFKCAIHIQNDLEALINLFQKLKISDELIKIQMLFNSPTQNLAIKFNETRATYVMQFLTVLNSSKIIESDNKRFGFYQVLECHVLNFKEIFLKGKDGQRGADRVRKLKDWEQRKFDFEKLLKDFIKNAS